MRNQSIDSTKLFFAITVVIMHGFLMEIKNPGYLIGLMTNGFFITAVPFYFIVSGYLFHKTIEKNHLKRWTKHILRTYLIWSLVYAYSLSNIILLENESVTRKLYLIVRAELTGVMHLWYIPALMTAAALCYLLRGFIQQKIKLTLVIIAILWLTGVALNWLFLVIESPNGFLYRNGFFYGMPMFILGYIFALKESHILAKAINLNRLILISVTLIVIESVITTTLIHGLTQPLHNNMDMMMTTPLLSALIFIICLKKPAMKIFQGVDRLLSTFMYYSHILFLEAILAIFSLGRFSWSEVTRDMVITVIAIISIIIFTLMFKKRVRAVV